MFSIIVLLIIILSLICILKELYTLKVIEPLTTNDILLSLFEDIPKSIINRNTIAVTYKKDNLCIFVINKSKSENNEYIIGYYNDEDLNYLKRIKKAYNLKGINKKLEKESDMLYCTYIFMKANKDDTIFTKMSSKYPLLVFNNNMKDKLNYFLPLSNTKKILDSYTKEIINIVEIPNIVINPKNTLVDTHQTTILNLHYGKKVQTDFNFQKNIERNTNTLKPENEYECIVENTGEKELQYKTREACESDYDAFGNLKEMKHKWVKLCRSDTDCEYYKKSKNKLRGTCMNGVCEKPLRLDGLNLFYGNDENDHAYENDVYDRIVKKLTPILNI
tara:strand:+ start:1617 stop:2615 length:999 start_codon:yes stop_codon:yes gene_type:complete